MVSGYGKYLALKDTKLVVQRIRSMLRKNPTEKKACQALGFTKTQQILVLEDRKEHWGRLKDAIKMVRIERVRNEDVPKAVRRMEGKKTLTAKAGDGIVAIGKESRDPRIVPARQQRWKADGQKWNVRNTPIEVESTVVE
ncbi:hypothetical protein NDN08_004707 [Rhodosorus marinus]|uniref:Ribosomal protein L30 ferredoxin-like fold domain-containing protein n=1 Tax=Rhodosorus marinus TaxID=101924 RepID=A0AAV8UM75_9RHOD|nr:hypothetical protein NDN08_004707 [Rhodosorus marinus]